MSGPIRRPGSENATRPVGGTEYSWCRAVPGGTGITVIALLLRQPPDMRNLQNALEKLHNYHPILRSKLRFDAPTNTFSFLTLPPLAASHVQIQTFNSSSTAEILRSTDDLSGEPHRIILEHELNNNTWTDPERWIDGEASVFFVSLYDLGDGECDSRRCVVTFRLHTAACDRTAAVTLLRDFLEAVTAEGDGGAAEEKAEEISPAIEDLIPTGKANKPFWARGMDVLGYSLNALRFSNLDFVEAESPKESQVVRMQMNRDETRKLVASLLLHECDGRGMKLWAAIAAAGMISAHSSKNLPEKQREKYAVVTLMDCRPILEPPLISKDFGFYHSGILHTHDLTEEETLWDLAERLNSSFTTLKNSDKHFTDMPDLNFLMCKAIENPRLTPSSSLRTALISVFEDPVFDASTGQVLRDKGVEDYLGCSSVHGVGPSIAVFDTMRDGCLDCMCVYPSPLHSRDQMQGLVQSMKAILLDT
ncbi:PREDICTED: uncharacterized protein LOC104799759 [Tarenaya hassleriana]|uniref:uncharacterized protein LOC104799759 n=1 Tax=Tarenaya hassleriana TaxID=28532 RepID=UPI00053C67FE|nr:PREDICTED: uncharacterized protein LOC104799759 [Tarenaya hassleriana]